MRESMTTQAMLQTVLESVDEAHWSQAAAPESAVLEAVESAASTQPRQAASDQWSVAHSSGRVDRDDGDRRRARRLLDRTIEYIWSPCFERPHADEEILGRLPVDQAGGWGRSAAEHPALSSGGSLRSTPATPPPGTPPYLADLYEFPLLTPDEEHELFRRMNFLKYRADVLREPLDPDRPQVGLLDQIEQLLADALEIRNRIVRANLRLVVSIAKKLVDNANSLDELISDGNLPLMRAVEIFDFERGTRFSTYATWAVRNTLYRSTPRNRRQQKRFRTGGHAVFESASDDRHKLRSRESYHQHLRRSLDRMLSRLDDRDQTIVKARFGLDREGTPRKFREIAETLDISTERVRQLLYRSLNRMHELAEHEPIEPA